MSEVKLVLRDSIREISCVWDCENVQRVIAALSADPMTIDELENGLQRFINAGSLALAHDIQLRLDDEPWDSGLIVVDIPARLVIAQCSHFVPNRAGTVRYHDGTKATRIEIGYDLADDWLIATNSDSWIELANDRRNRRLQVEVDTRAVLYGRPFIEFVARECFSNFPRREIILQNARVRQAMESRARVRHQSMDGLLSAATAGALAWSELDDDAEDSADDELTLLIPARDERSSSPFNDTLKEIHARWLLTPRADLQDQIPRDILLVDHEHRMRDMEQRCDQWSRLQECPPGLQISSHAFQYSGFGTHELVKYYDLVRELLWSCWHQLFEMHQTGAPSQRPASISECDFLVLEIPRLEQVREEWLDAPDPDFDGRTPRSIIDRERARIPEVVSEHEAMIDPDCPCCQMLAELPGPMFWHLDASGMDQEFAFSIYERTREDWDAHQEECAQMDLEFAGELSDSTDATCQGATSEASHSESIWSRSFSVADSGQMPSIVRLFGFGGHLGELTVDLREQPNSRHAIDQLHRDFGNLREVLNSSDQNTQSLVGPTILRFTETLDDVAERFPDLEAKCSDLIRQLQAFEES